MKKLLLTAALLACCLTSLFAQPCLPYGIIFTTQSQIDYFQNSHPDCTEIEGDVEINGNDITNLDGLNVVTIIEGGLKIKNNDALTSISGLENLTSIGDYLEIRGNDALTNLTGLENLTSVEGYLGIGAGQGASNGNLSLSTLMGLDNIIFVGGDLRIFGNSSLTSLMGLDNLTSIGGDLRIEAMDSLTSLSGLEGLNSIGGGLYIGPGNEFYYNAALTSLTGLDNLTSIGGDLWISDNNSLTSLTGLDNLDAGSIDNLTIYYNPILSTCEAQSICEYLASPGGIVSIHSNASGCNNPGEIALACGFALPCLPYGNYYFLTQEEIDNFETNYPDCNDLAGFIWIGGVYSSSDISNLYGLSTVTGISGNIYIISTSMLASLSGLDNITSVSGNLLIGSDHSFFNGNSGLTSLTGLDNLVSVGGNLIIADNDILANLSGLENLTYIGGGLKIGAAQNGVSGGNPLLNNLQGLQNLAMVEGYLEILYNPNLTSLSGLDSIDAGSIDSLYIHDNFSLSECEVQSICNYLAAPNGEVNIQYNAPGCNSPEEVEEACASCLPEGITFSTQAEIDSFQINYPNCTEIEGDVHINGEDINNLNGLIVLTSIGGTLEIGNNEILTTLTGLENLTSIGQSLFIVHTDTLLSLTGLEGLTTIDGVLHVEGNNKLIDFTGLDNIITIGSNFYVDLNGALENFHGLENLISIGGDFLIGGINIAFWIGNPSLVDLSGLENLTTVDGGLTIAGNYTLSNLMAINNLNNVGEGLSIFLNPSLAECDIQSICDYLAIPNGDISIYENAPGCNSQKEVEDACTQSVVEFSIINNLSIYPNPFNNSISIEFELKQPETITINIYNHLGQQIELLSESRSVGQQKIEWDCKGLPAGIYFCVLKTNSGMETTKMIKL